MATREEEAAARSEILLRDAEEALAQERLREFWTQWGSTIIGMAVMLVIGTGAGVAWREWRQSANENSTSALLRIVDSGQYIMSENFASDMKKEHAALAWLSEAKDANSEVVQGFLEQAAKNGGESAWGWLGRWNLLRQRMDDEKEDPEKLIGDYKDLADDMRGKSMAALAWTDAAVIAGERLKDPARALDYLAQAEKLVERAGPMGVIIGDLRHLYVVRAQDAALQAGEEPQEPTTENAQ